MPKTETKKEATVPRRDSPVPEIVNIELTRIDANPWQPRKTQQTEEQLMELVDSMSAVGQLEPIIVREHPTREGRYQRMDGAMRCLALARNGAKTALAMVKPLTDKEMRVMPLAANTFIKLSDADRRAAVILVWKMDFGGEGADVSQGANAGIREMARETKLPKTYIDSCVQAQETLNEAKGNKELRTALKDLSTRELVMIKEIVAETPNVALTLAQARTSKEPIKSKELQEIAQMVKAAATPAEKVQVAQDIIQSKRDVQKEKDKIEKHAQESLVARVKAEHTPEARAEKAVADREKLDAEQKRKEDEIKKQVNVDTQLRMRYFDIQTQIADKTSDVYYRRIVNIRNETTKFQTAESIHDARKKLDEFDDKVQKVMTK